MNPISEESFFTWTLPTTQPSNHCALKQKQKENQFCFMKGNTVGFNELESIPF